MDFLLEEALLWIDILAICDGLNLKCPKDGFVSYKHSFHKASTGGSCDVFIRCLDTHSDGTHSLQRIHWWASHIMLYFSKSVPVMKTFIYILDGLRVSTFSSNVNFGVGFAFNIHYVKPSQHVLELRIKWHLCSLGIWQIWIVEPNPQTPRLVHQNKHKNKHLKCSSNVLFVI